MVTAIWIPNLRVIEILIQKNLVIETLILKNWVRLKEPR